MKNIKKAAVMACLFLCANVSFSQEFSFKGTTRGAYEDVLNLDPVSVRATLTVSAPEDLYVQALSEAAELILGENAEKFSIYEAAFEKRVDQKNGGAPGELFVKAELHLQWVFVYLKFGHEFDAAIQLRKAYQITKDLRKKYPDYRAALKTSGLLNVMIGSVPDKYNWILDVLDMHGDVGQGLKELESLKNSPHDLAFEANLWHAFILGFVLQQPENGLKELDAKSQLRDNLATRFLRANLLIKNSNSEEALRLIESMEETIDKDAFPYFLYLRGELLLHKGLYEESVKSYEAFLVHYKGQNYLKDAYYKMGICYWLMNKVNAANKEFEIARNTGKETTEADRYASKALLENEPPPAALVQLRYFTDGGYYQQALEIVRALDSNSFSDRKNQVEFLYRKARLYHKLKDIPQAVLLYRETIEANGESEWYFAPNACLQLGYIAMDADRHKEAREYFNKALSYRKHEYKNSIDSKARSGLAQLRDRR
jgi:tetratricopeptide (TPR) repeat protein